MTGSVYKTSLEAKLISQVQPVVEQLGYALRDIEMEGHKTLRIIVDAPAGGPDVGIDDCEKVHRTLSPLFDVWDPLPGAYTLEVSSPGEKPALRTTEHFQQAIGGRIFFETLEPLPMPEPAKPRRRWEGELKAVENNEVHLSDAYGEHKVPLNLIKNAQWLREWTLHDAKA